MAQTLTATLKPSLQVSETLGTNVSSTISDATLVPTISYVAGNSAVALGINADFIKGANTVTLNSSASVTYTLTALTDDATRAITLAGGVRVFYLTVTSRTAGDFLTVGAAASNPWTSPFASANAATASLKVYDFIALGVGSTDKYAVANGSNEQLKIVNSGSNPITFKVALLGCAT